MVQEIEFKEKTGKTFEEFHKTYKPSLVNYLKRFTNDEVTAQDVADDTLIKSLEDIHKFNPEKAQISTWVFTCAKNAMLHVIKKAKKFESIEEDHDGATIADFLHSNLSENNEEKELMLQKQVALVKKGILNLPEKYARILTMRLIDGLSYDEIAEVEDLVLNTVKSRIRGGKQLLKKKIQTDMRKLEEEGV
jgi:RNA polymerase sigma-70 factor (ECF subfamily)